MVFVNKKLGNGFAINVADSSKDQEHYFGDHKKYHGFRVKFLSGTGGNTFGSADYVSSSDGVITFFNANGYNYRISGTLWDQNDVFFENEDSYPFLGSNLLNDSGSVTKKLLAKMTWEISSSVLVSEGQDYVLGQELPLKYSDSNDYNYLNLNTRRDTLITTLDDGWLRLERVFPFDTDYVVDSGKATRFESSLLDSNGEKTVTIAFQMPDRFSAQATSSLRNVELDFLEPLSDGGVEKYKEIDNQHNKNIQLFVNVDVFKKVE